eukprot:5439861-Amphidinium_carterae.1
MQKYFQHVLQLVQKHRWSGTLELTKERGIYNLDLRPGSKAAGAVAGFRSTLSKRDGSGRGGRY